MQHCNPEDCATCEEQVCDGILDDGNSLRDEVKDAIGIKLAEYFGIDFWEVDTDLVCEVADEVLSTLGFTEEEQDAIVSGKKEVMPCFE